MKYLGSIYHFLGSIYLAIGLIATAAALTIAGTLIESKTDSHQYAAQFTYKSPWFALLLWGFFINILFSATRRWPFKKKHVPFLMTHAGLLMILGGVLIKNYFGLQGSMGLIEGSASDEIFEAGTYVVQLEKRGEQAFPLRYELLQNSWGHRFFSHHQDDLHLEVVDYFPHSSERLQTWIKQNQGHITGLRPFPVHEWNGQTLEDLPVSAQFESWNIYAFRTSQLAELVKAAYLQGMHMRLVNRHTEEVVYEGSLSQALKQPVGEAKVALSLEIAPKQGFLNPELTLDIDSNQVVIPLAGPHSLIHNSPSKTYLGHAPLAIDLERPPALLFIEDDCVYLFAFDAHGRVHSQIFQHNALNPIVTYDKGFGGYSVQAEIPFGKSLTRQDIENIQKTQLIDQLKKERPNHSHLAPPLVCFKNACLETQQEFEDSCVAFLAWWNHNPQWLYPAQTALPKPLNAVFAALTFSPQEQKACQWISRVFQEIDPQLAAGKDIPLILQQIRWPIEPPTDLDAPSLLTLLTQQISAVGDLLPPLDQTSEALSPEEKAHLFSAYLRLFGIHWSTIAAEPSINVESFVLESPITSLKTPLPPTKKIEDNLPLISLKISKGNAVQWLALTYDPHASNFRWPIFNGEYLIRFQPKFQKIPYKLRLRQARQINYANSLQPYSYESDLLITNKKTKSSLDKTISMNHVHETWDGFRFYLANIFPATEVAVKHVQIVVNHDPAKYILTYPGAFLLSLGILLLFWMKPYHP